MDNLIVVAIMTSITSVIGSILVFIVSLRKAKPEAIKTTVETNGVSADTASKYRAMLNAEIEERRKAESRCDELDDAFKQCVDENEQLRAENRILRDQVRAAGLPDLLRKPDTRPVSKRGEQ